MKKIISLLLCGLLVVSLAACGGNAGQENNDTVDTLDTSSESGMGDENKDPAGSTQDAVDSAGDEESSGRQEAVSTEGTDADTFTGSNILVAFFPLRMNSMRWA